MPHLPRVTPPTGIVFDLQRGSFHDGPGIRTTVFLKGCPLHCAWCHNPESQRAAPELAFDADRCCACQACVSACATNAHAFDPSGHHLVDFARCVVAGACVSACPSGALRLYGYETTVAAIMTEVEKDRGYYETSGGGLTLSGGEPLLQPAFAQALLAAARDARIHTCVQTCGAASWEAYAAIVPHADLFLFDWKVTDSMKHAALTGASNNRILNNLRRLHDGGAAVLLRCPLIPGINDDREHLIGIAHLARSLSRLRGVEVLPYHATGEGKYARLGRAQSLEHVQPPDREVIERWHSLLREAGCANLVES